MVQETDEVEMRDLWCIHFQHEIFVLSNEIELILGGNTIFIIEIKTL